MRKKLVAKIKAGTHALEFDNGNVEQLNKLDKALDYRGDTVWDSRDVNCGKLICSKYYGLTTDRATDLPTIKLSKIFKPKKVKKPETSTDSLPDFKDNTPPPKKVKDCHLNDVLSYTIPKLTSIESRMELDLDKKQKDMFKIEYKFNRVLHIHYLNTCKSRHPLYLSVSKQKESTHKITALEDGEIKVEKL